MARSLFETSPSGEAASFWDRLTAYVPQSEFFGSSQPAEQDDLEFARKAEHLDVRRQQGFLIRKNRRRTRRRFCFLVEIARPGP